MATLTEFTGFDLSQSLNQGNTFTDFLSENFNGKRMKYSAMIGAVAGMTDSSLTATLGGAINGFMNSDSDNFFGKVLDSFKGMAEAQAVMRVVEMLPEETRKVAALMIGGVGFMTGNYLQNAKESKDFFIESQMATNPAVDMMRGIGANDLLEATKKQSEDNYDHVKDPDVKKYLQMT